MVEAKGGDEELARQPAVARAYSYSEAILTQLGRELATEGGLVPVHDLRLIDVLNFEQQPLRERAEIAWKIWETKETAPDWGWAAFRRNVSLWHWREDSLVVLFREWLRQHGGANREGLQAALDSLVVRYLNAGLTLQQAEQLTLLEALNLACPPIQPAAAARHAEPKQDGMTEGKRPTPTPLVDQFLEFTAKQRTLLVTLAGKEQVSIDDALKAVYGNSSRDKMEALLKLKDRTNATLASKRPALEIKRAGETFRLQPI